MRFAIASEVELFAGSVRGVLAGWEPPLEPVFGDWQDDRDDRLAVRLVEVGWTELWSDPDLVVPAVAGGIELGRAVAPLSLVDEPTLGGPLVVAGRARHGAGRVDGRKEPTLDGTGTLVGSHGRFAPEPVRLPLWGAVMLGYLAGVADGALERAIAHARDREQFGAPLAALAAVQAHLADAALLRDGLLLSAFGAAVPGGDLAVDELAWAGGACREATARVQQVHGAFGFALEGGIHRFFRRAKSAQVWIDAVLAEHVAYAS